MIDSTLKNANILIVDDKQNNIDILVGLLEFQGYSNIKTTTDSRLVVALFEMFKPDIILLDLNMPHFSGFEIIEQLQAFIPANVYMPILVLTADISMESRKQALSIGAKDFISKPFDLKEVDLRIKNLLETRYLYQQLNHQNIILDEIVQERTYELEKKNNDLKLAIYKSDESNRLKTAFLNNISHEIRTPFNGLLGFMSLLQDDDLTKTERDEYIKEINTSAFRLMHTINDIVESSKIQAGELKPDIRKTNFKSLAKDVFKRYKSAAEKKGLAYTITNHLPKNIEYLQTSSTELDSILSILLDNAIKFTSKGSIEFGLQFKNIRTAETTDLQYADQHIMNEIATNPNTEVLEFYVKDSGIGISENHQQLIFEHFMQVDVSNTRQYEGAGLGLSIAKAQADLLGGKIYLESVEGYGSVFYLSLPYRKVMEESTDSKDITSVLDSGSQAKDLNILIVDDDEISGILIQMAVKNINHQLFIEKTGNKAVEACLAHPEIDLVLMDIRMPDMDGLEATRKIREFNSKVIIIVQTAYAMKDDKEKAIEAGCNDYISKPIKREDLITMIKKYF